MMRRHGIRHRLNLIIIGAVAIGLLATFAMFSVRDVQQRRGALLTELHSMADVIAFNAAAVIEFDVADEDLRFFDERIDDWRLEACLYRFSVGFSSRDLPLTAHRRFDGNVWRAT